ncbi:MAG: ankyrin repeat domain-containing protein [Actinomycetota bacterium]|nr:ankyrin repeat domain-containing protein [Actinomycetota bacterium]MDA8277737.1 ankyrin repeat domain-containing protein [Actinomycetota bacterium]
MKFSIEDEPWFLSTSTADAISLVIALKAGDLTTVRALFEMSAALSNVRLIGDNGSRESWRTPLHVITDWPGFFDNAPEMAKLIMEAGGNPNIDCGGSMPETPLHYLASSDDVDVARVLIDGGADINRAGGSIGKPLDNAVGYGCWSVAALLVARGARVDSLWVAAGVGLTDRIAELIELRGIDRSATGSDDLEGAFSQSDLDQALWHGCQGGNVRAVKLLLTYGASFESRPDYAGDQSHQEVVKSLGTQRQHLLEFLSK